MESAELDCRGCFAIGANCADGSCSSSGEEGEAAAALDPREGYSTGDDWSSFMPSLFCTLDLRSLTSGLLAMFEMLALRLRSVLNFLQVKGYVSCKGRSM